MLYSAILLNKKYLCHFSSYLIDVEVYSVHVIYL